MISLDERQIDDLLENVIGTKNPNIWKDGEKLVCCPVHGESNPSMGISVEKGVCHCFSCSFAGDFVKLLMYSLPDTFGLNTSTPETLKKTGFRAYRKAEDFISSRYEVEIHSAKSHLKGIRRYGESKKIIRLTEDRKILPMYKLAPYQSGKTTYQYFFQRGFTRDNVSEFKIGSDVFNKTITIPVFYEDGLLAGIIGRYIDANRKKNQRYKIYDDFERSSLLYPLNMSKPKEGVIILVEGQFDVIRMHNAGYTNTYALMTNSLSRKQADWIFSNCTTVIWVGDNDERGLEGRDKAIKMLRGKVQFKIVDYPSHGKDVCDWSDEEIQEMLSTAHSTLVRRIRRL